MVKRTKCEIWSRVVGYIRPVQQWNEGKEAEFNDRVMFDVSSKSTEDKNGKKKKINT